MPKELNAGFGHCIPEATTKVVAPLSWIEGGKIQNFAKTVMFAVHDHNRHANDGDFIAVDFPRASYERRGRGRPGPIARLIGSRAALSEILAHERLEPFISSLARPMPVTTLDPVESGYALIRTRRSDKAEPGHVRRQIDRNERTKHSTKGLEIKLEAMLSMTRDERLELIKTDRQCCIFMDKIPMIFTRRVFEAKEGTPRVNTYGFSDPEAPVLFATQIVDNEVDETGARKMVRDIYAECFG